MIANSQSTSAEPAKVGFIYSDLADDPDMAELIETYVADLQERALTLEQLASANDRAALASLTHQIKGSAGGFGFMPITDQAGVVEKIAKTQTQAEELQQAVNDLIDLCRRARCRAA